MTTENPSPPRPRVPIRLIVGLLVSVIAFVVLVAILGNATVALAVTDGVPLLWLVAFAIWHRRLEPVALIPAAVFTLALLLTLAFGGSALPLELRRSVLPGAVGLACLISLAVGRPLLALAAAKAARVNPRPESRPGLDTPEAQQTLATLTAIIGVAATADAAAQIVLALTVSTTTFGVVARIASWAIIGSGLAICALYLRWRRAAR